MDRFLAVGLLLVGQLTLFAAATQGVCSLTQLTNSNGLPGTSIWLDVDFGGQVTPYVLTLDGASAFLARFEFLHIPSGLVYSPVRQWSTITDTASRAIVMTDTGFRVLDPVFSLGNWSISIRAVANEQYTSYRFLLNNEPFTTGFVCNASLAYSVRLLAAVDGLLSFSAPVRKCSGSALVASDIQGWNCTGTLTAVSTGESVPAGFSRLWKCSSRVNDSSLIMPFSTICDQYGTPCSSFFRGLVAGDALGGQPFGDFNVNSNTGVFQTYWFTSPVTGNLTMALTRSPSIFNDSAMAAIDTFGYLFDNWMAYSLLGAYNSSGEQITVNRRAAVAVATVTTGIAQTSSAYSSVYSSNQFPLSQISGCKKADFVSAAGLRCNISGFASPSVSQLSRIACIDSTTLGTSVVTETRFPVSGVIDLYLSTAAMLDTISCFASSISQVVIEDTSSAPLLDTTAITISSAKVTSLVASAVPTSLQLNFSDGSSYAPSLSIQRLLTLEGLTVLCDGAEAVFTGNIDSITNGSFSIGISGCNSNYSSSVPPGSVIVTLQASSLYASGRQVGYSRVIAGVSMSERVTGVTCASNTIFVYFDQAVSVLRSTNFLASSCTASAVTMRGGYGRTIVLEMQSPGDCLLSFFLESGSRVELNGTFCASSCSQPSVAAATSVYGSYFVVDFDGPVCDAEFLSSGYIFVQSAEGGRLPILGLIATTDSRAVFQYSHFANSTGATFWHELVNYGSPVDVNTVSIPYADAFTCRRNVFSENLFFVTVTIPGSWTLNSGASASPDVCTVRSATRSNETGLIELILPSGDEDDLQYCVITVNYTSTLTMQSDTTAFSLSRCDLPVIISGPANLFSDADSWVGFVVMFVYVALGMYVCAAFAAYVTYQSERNGAKYAKSSRL